MNKIQVTNFLLYSIYLWDNNHLFVGYPDDIIRLIELIKKNEKILNNWNECKGDVLTFKKIIQPKLGEYLIPKGFRSDQIKLLIIEN